MGDVNEAVTGVQEAEDEAIDLVSQLSDRMVNLIVKKLLID